MGVSFAWYPSLSTIVLRFAHVAAGEGSSPLLTLGAMSLYGRARVRLSIHLLVEVQAVFQCLPVSNTAAETICAQVFVWTQTSTSLGEWLVAGEWGIWHVFVFLRNKLLSAATISYHATCPPAVSLPGEAEAQEDTQGGSSGCHAGATDLGKWGLCLLTGGQA